MKILITGATGFVGSYLTTLLSSQGKLVRAAVRKSCVIPGVADICVVEDVSGHTDWTEALVDVDVVIHLAARAHIMKDASLQPLLDFRKTNTEGTINLAAQAASSGVSRFIFLSSIKVNGEFTKPDMPFKADDVCSPLDPYGISKHEAELGLRKISLEFGMETVIIRPPLVYGPGVKANFLNLIRIIQKKIPLPFGSINNCRSLVALGNLADLIITCIDHTAAVNQVFLVSDGEDLSTTCLIKRIGRALGRPTFLFPVPQSVLEIILCAVGKKVISQRLCSDLRVDITKTRDVLNWVPPLSVDSALLEAVNYTLQKK